nr:lipopolysaccharide biosynthesis protein [Thioclava sp.]
MEQRGQRDHAADAERLDQQDGGVSVAARSSLSLPAPMNSIRADLGWSLLGQGMFLIAQAGLVVALARLAPLEDVGRYGIAVSLASITFLAAGLGLRMGLATDPEGRARFGVYLGLRALTTGATLAVIAVTALALGLRDPALGMILAMVALARTADALSDLSYGAFQSAGRMDPVARSLALRGLAGLSAFVAVLLASGSVALGVAGQAVAWAAVALGHDLPQAARFVRLRPDFKRTRLVALLRETRALGLAMLLGEIGTAAPRLIVGALLPLALAGIYTAVGYVLVLGTAFAAALSQAMAMRLARANREGQGAFGRMLARFAGGLAALGCAALVIVALFGGPLLNLVFGPGFAAETRLLTLMTGVLALRLPIGALQTGLVAQRRFACLAGLRFGVMLAILSGAVAGAQIAGLEGVALALLIVSSAQLALLIALSRPTTSCLSKEPARV